MTELWISIFGYEYLEFTTIVDIHNSVMETIMDIIAVAEGDRLSGIRHDPE